VLHLLKEIAPKLTEFGMELLTVVAAFINAIAFRQLGMLRKKQVRRPMLDFLIELAPIVMFSATLAWMIHQGLENYPGRVFDGKLIGLMTFVCFEL
jgi:hypothetical protein